MASIDSSFLVPEIEKFRWVDENAQYTLPADDDVYRLSDSGLNLDNGSPVDVPLTIDDPPGGRR